MEAGFAGWLKRRSGAGFLLAALALLAPGGPSQAAAPVFTSTGTLSNGTGAVSPAWPAHQADDIGLLFIEAEGDGAVSLTTANGFVLVSSITTGAAAGNTLLAIYWARATSSAMAAPRVADAGDHTIAVIHTFRGTINNKDPWDILSSGIKAAASTSVTATGVTTTQRDTLAAVAVNRSNDANGAAFSAWSNANLAGLTENYDDGSNSGKGGGIAVATGRKEGAGATGDTTATVDSSVNAFITIALKPLNPPATGVIQNVGETQLGADWTLRDGATGYTLAASTNAGASPSPIAASSTTAASSAVISDPALNPNTTYYLFVRSDGLRQSSGWDTWAATSTLAKAPVFDNFTGLANNAVQFNWTANGNPAGTLYRVKVSTAPDPLSPGGAVVSSSDTYNLYLSSSGLAVNATYYFRAAAVNNNNVITAYTAAQGTATLANQPVFDSFSGLTETAAQFNWTANGNPAGTLYRVKVSTAPDPLAPGGAVVTSSDTYNLYLGSSGLVSNTTYYFRAAAVNLNAVETAYTAAQATATLAAAPVFNNFTGLAGNAIQFNWLANGNPAGTLYRVKVSTAPDPLSPSGAVVSSSDTYNLYLSSSGLAVNATYYFRAAAINQAGTITAYTASQGTATLANQPVFDSFSGLTETAAQFNWTANGNPAGTLYRVKVSTASDPLAPGGAVVSSSDTYNLYLSSPGLSSNTTYYFRAAAVNLNAVETAYTAAQATATLAAAPVFDSFSGVAETAAQFNWLANGNPAGTLYRVAVSTAPDPLAPAGAVVSSSDTYNLYLSSSGLAVNATYYFRAAAVGHGGTVTAYTAAQGTATLANQPAFDSFTGITLSEIQFNWTAANPAGTLYRVKVSTAPDPLAPGGAVATSSDTYNLFLSSPGLAVNTRYYFRAAAVNHNGVETAYTAAKGTFTLAGLPAFDSFTGVTASAQQFNWTSANPGGTLYRVKASTAPDPLSPGGAVATSSDTYNSYLSSTGLSGNTTYYYRVAAANGDGVETAYTAAQGTSTLAAQPSAFDFTSVSSYTIRLDWSGSGNGPGTLYRVKISTAADPLAPAGAAVTSSDTYNLYVSTAGLAADTSYYFRAAAGNNNGLFTDYTAAVSTKTLLAGALAAPVAGSRTPFVSSITANWELVSGATGYVLAVSTNSGAPPSPIFSSSETAALSAYVINLDTDTVYYPFVRAGGDGSASTWSDYPAVATLLEFAPVFDAFSGLGNTAVTFAWTSGGNAAGTRYRVWSSTAPDPLVPGGAVAVSSDTYNLSLSTTGLSVNTTYYFRVAGINKDGVATEYTAARASATLANAPAFDSFSGLAESVIQFNLADGGNPPGTLYRVKVSTAPDPLAPDNAVVSSSDTYNLYLSSSGLAVNATYYFRAAAVGHGGTVTAYTAAQGTATLANQPVFDSFTGVTETAARFNWTVNGNPAGTLYRVKVSTAADPLAPGGAVVTASDTYNAYLSSSGLASDTSYYFRAAAVNNNGVPTAYTAAESTRTLTFAPVSDGFTSVAAASVQFNWLANGNPAGTLYRVKASTAPDPLAPGGAVVSSSDTYNLFLSSSGLVADTTYYFSVAGVNGGGSPTAYTAARGTATLLEFAPVFDKFTSISTNSVQFNWTSGGNPAGTLYRAVASLAADPLNPGSLATTSSDTYNLFLSSVALGPNTTYYFVVAGINKNGVATAYTAARGTSTLAEEPVFKDFTNISAGAIQFNYAGGANPKPDTQYRVLTSTASDPLAPAGAEVITTNTSEWSVYLTGLAEKTTYYFRAAAFNNNGVATAYSVAESTVTPPSVATRLFLRTSASPVDANARLMNSERGSAVATSTKSTVAGPVTPPDTATQFTASAGGSTVTWYTPPLQTSTISANVVFNIWAAENSNAANATVTGVLYRAGKDGVLISTIAAALIPRAELTTALAVQNWTKAPASTALNEGDRLAAVFYIDDGDGVTMASGREVYATLDGPTAASSGDSWVQTGETLAPVKPPGFSVTAVTTYSVTAGWELVEGATSYTFAVSLEATNPPVTITASSVTVATSAAAGDALAANTTYYLFARSHGLGSVSSYGAYGSTVTLARAPVFDSFSEVAARSAKFNWLADGNPAGTRYRVAVSTAPDPLAPAGALVTSSDTYNLYFTSSGLNSGTAYYFRAAAVSHSVIVTSYTAAQSTSTLAMYLNEVYPSGATAAADWAELYNKTNQTVSLEGWKLNYVENTIAAGGTPTTVWTGQAGDTVVANSTFTLAGFSVNLNGAQTYHVKLLDAAGGVADEVQWPVLAEGQSFARAGDGAATYFEIDPTPTRDRFNATSTDTYRINEVAYGPLAGQFIELYNKSDASTATLSGYALRNKSASAGGLVFRFTRKIYPLGYAALDASSVSDDGYTFTKVFGSAGLAAAGDFLALENSTGTVVDAVAWQSAGNNPRYDNRGSTIALADYAPADSTTTIMRQPSEGADTGSDSADFALSSSPTLGSRNNSAGGAAANTLTYPGDNSAPRYLSRRFPLRLTLGAASTEGQADTLILSRTGGAADQYSPHVFRLAGLGFDLASTAAQATEQNGPGLADQDGRPLVSSASYRLVLNSDSASASAPQIVRDTVTYDGSVHTVTASTAAPKWMNDASRAAVVKVLTSNNSPAGFNRVAVATVAFRLLDADLNALTQQQARDLFEAVMLARDDPDGTEGLYEPGIDLTTAAYVPMGQITLDGLGYSTLTVAADYQWAAEVPAASTAAFYVVLESTRDASARAPHVFRAALDPASVLLLDVSGGLPQDFTASAKVETSSVTLIAPAKPPAGSSCPYVTPSSAPINTITSYYPGTIVSARSYLASTDGYLRALSTGCELLWEFATSPLSPINSSPTDGEEDGGKVYLYFADDNGDVYKLRDDGASATQIWKRSLATQVRSNIIVSGSKLYFGAADSKMHCIDKTTTDGANCAGWSDLAVSSAVAATVCLDDRTGVNAAWVGDDAGKLVQLKTGDGTQAASYTTGSAIRSSPFGDTAWKDSTDKLFVTSTDKNLYFAARDFATVDKNFTAPAPIHTSPFVWTFGGERFVFFGDDAGYMHKVSTRTWSEPAGWPFQAGGAIRSGPLVMPAGNLGLADGEDYVYFGSDDCYIYAVKIDTGKLRTGWPVATGGPVRANPALDPDDNLAVGSNDGRVYVLKIK